MSAANTSRRAFSLVELLAVVVIIMVMLSLLSPLIGQLRERGRMVTCLGNLKQFGTGILTFTGEHDGFLTATISTGSYQGSEPWQKGWMGKEALPPDMAAPRPWYNEYGVLKDYLSSETLKNRVFRCPSLEQGVLGSGVGSNGIHDYGMHAAFSGAKTSLLPTRATVARPDGKVLTMPAPVFSEEEPAYGLNDSYIDPDHTTINREGSWHAGRSSNYFATDGSAHTIQWGASPGPQVYSWLARAPSGNVISLGNVYGWAAWNRQ